MNLKRYLQAGAYPRFIKHSFEAFIESIGGRRRLLKAYPELSGYDKLVPQVSQKLQPYYQKYICEVSKDEMALSLELAIFITVMCQIFKPKSVLDLGSGFSSFVFRLYMLEADSKPVVCSVDDSPEWLDKTRVFLTDNDLPHENLMSWQSFIEGNRDKFDFILYDLGSIQLRRECLKKTLELANSNGKIVLDDIHKPGYWSYAKQVLKESKLEYYSLRSFTKDCFGRYSALVTV